MVSANPWGETKSYFSPWWHMKLFPPDGLDTIPWGGSHFKRHEKGQKTAFNSACLPNSAARPSLVPELQYQCTSEADTIPSVAAQLNPRTLQA